MVIGSGLEIGARMIRCVYLSSIRSGTDGTTRARMAARRRDMTQRRNLVLQWVQDRLSYHLERLPLDTTEQIRLHQFSVFVLIGIPIMLAFGIHQLIEGNRVLGLVDCALAGAIGMSRWLVGKMRSGLSLYRFNAFLCAGFLLYMLTLGGDGGSKALWLFTFPLIALFMLGNREGLVWTTALFASALFLVSGWVKGISVYPYPAEAVTRFSVTFCAITAIGYWFEFLRQHYRKGMEQERRRLVEEQGRLRGEIACRLKAEEEREALILDLQEAVSRVHQLRGLLPICSACKKIRGDHGQWVQIEIFVRERSEAEFSHSICPDCVEHMYPGLVPNR
jgi:hypothetical protein